MKRMSVLGWAATIIGVAFGIATSLAAEPANVPTRVPPGVKLVLADDANQVASLMRLSGEQQKLAAQVSYANFSSGPLRLEAIRAGAAQMGAVGDVPPILAHFSDANVLIVGAVVTSGQANQLATAPNSTIATLADLKGKRIGINTGTAQQAIVLRNLRAAGLSIEDITPVNLGIAEFADALRAGQIDAAVLKQPDRARYLASVQGSNARALANAAGTQNNIRYIYASRTALGDPVQAAAIRDFLVHWYRAHLWRNRNKEVWISDYFIKDQRLKPEDARIAAESEGDATSIPGLDKLLPVQQDTIDLLQKAGQFKGKTLKAADEFDLRFKDLNESTDTGTN